MAYEFIAPLQPRPPSLLRLFSLILLVIVSLIQVWLSSDLERLRSAEQRLREQQEVQQEATLFQIQILEERFEEQHQAAYLADLHRNRIRTSVQWGQLLLYLPENITLYSARGSSDSVELSGNARSLRAFSAFLELLYRGAEYHPESFTPLVHQSGEETSYSFTITLARLASKKGVNGQHDTATP